MSGSEQSVDVDWPPPDSAPVPLVLCAWSVREPMANRSAIDTVRILFISRFVECPVFHLTLLGGRFSPICGLKPQEKQGENHLFLSIRQQTRRRGEDGGVLRAHTHFG